jgi:hypothetical protein
VPDACRLVVQVLLQQAAALSKTGSTISNEVLWMEIMAVV